MAQLYPQDIGQLWHKINIRANNTSLHQSSCSYLMAVTSVSIGQLVILQTNLPHAVCKQCIHEKNNKLWVNTVQKCTPFVLKSSAINLVVLRDFNKWCRLAPDTPNCAKNVVLVQTVTHSYMKELHAKTASLPENQRMMHTES